MESTFMMWLIIAIVPLCGIICAITPFLMPRNECFAVTVPEAAQEDTRLKGMKRTYCITLLVITAVCTALVAWICPETMGHNDVALFTIVYMIATMLPLAFGFALMLMYRKRVQALKAEKGWGAQQQLAASVVAGSAEIPQPLSMRWNILYVPVLIAVAALIYALYPLMPDQLPMNVDLSGKVSNVVAKTPVSACFPLFVDIFLAVVFIFCNWSILRSKRAIDPSKAMSSAYAYGTFARIQSITLLICGIVLCIAIGVLIPLSMAGVINLMKAGIILLIIALIVVVVMIFISIRYGQSGSRVFEGAEDSTSMARDDDRYWKLGVFYVNAEDPSIFVPKRFGFGWTCNFARPATWAILIGFIVFVIAFIVLVSLLFK